ncbi:hypothetical protein [Brevibacillus laterosporus]|uniref:hypothetical protein n=1 Tax=Brevibacillus laterosporus TaxID=1465 RepID=UPI003D256965
MAHRKIFDKFSIDPSFLDMDLWPSVLIDTLSDKKRKLFFQRKRAVEMYLNPRFTLSQITDETGISKSRLLYFVKRCLSLDDKGTIWGLRALIPQKNLKPYTRTDPLEHSEKLTGSFQMLLSKYPQIDVLIHEKILNINQSILTEPVMKQKFVHKKFLEACRSVGLTMSDYPFTTKDLGRRSLYRYIKSIENNFPGKAAARYGVEAARNIKNTGIGEKQPTSIKPFQRVEFDGHQIDLILTLTFQNQYGDECTDTIERIWLLVIIDVATRVVLGYHISIASQYSSSDVLTCIRNAVEPNLIKTVTIPGLNYPEKGGFHWQVLPETSWALWNEFSYDNGKANLAKIVTNRLSNIVGCALNPGPVNMPERRSIIERFFGILEQNGFQRLYNTTGSNPADPRRKSPEKKVRKYAMNVDELEQITAVLISHYNCTPHSGLGYLSPLEVMEQRVKKGMVPRILPEEIKKEVCFFEMTITRIIRGSLKRGKRPYITFEGVEYRNDIVSSTFGMIGEQIFLLVNTNDIRFLKAYLKDGSELGYFTATGKWGVSPHSLQMRKQINGLVRKKILYYFQYEDPIDALHKYLEEKATNNKKSRTRLAATQRYLEEQQYSHPQEKEKQKKNRTPKASTVPVLTNQTVSNIKELDDLDSLRKKFKTINI